MIPQAGGLCNKFPVGTGHSGDAEMFALDVDSSGTKIALGGTCNAAGLCGPDKPLPLIQLWETTDLSTYKWSIYIPRFSSTTYSNVYSLCFNPDASMLAAALNLDSN
jgi:hypothetical protein